MVPDSINQKWVQLLGVLKLGRLLRLGKIISLMNADEDLKAGLRIFKMILFLFVYLHCFTCTWWLIIDYDQAWVTPQPEYDTEDGGIYIRPTSTKYLICLLNTVQITLGSDIFPMGIL